MGSLRPTIGEQEYAWLSIGRRHLRLQQRGDLQKTPPKSYIASHDRNVMSTRRARDQPQKARFATFDPEERLQLRVSRHPGVNSPAR